MLVGSPLPKKPEKPEKPEKQKKPEKPLGKKAIKATATATLAISHNAYADQDDDKTGYKPQEAGGEPQVDVGSKGYEPK